MIVEASPLHQGRTSRHVLVDDLSQQGVELRAPFPIHVGNICEPGVCDPIPEVHHTKRFPVCNPTQDGEEGVYPLRGGVLVQIGLSER